MSGFFGVASQNDCVMDLFFGVEDSKMINAAVVWAKEAHNPYIKDIVNIYENKKKTRKKVYNFVFGKVLGKEKAFLIQNIFPTTEEYIESKYQNKMKDVEITETLKQEIIGTSMNVIKLAKKGINIPFYDILEMKNILLENKNT